MTQKMGVETPEKKIAEISKDVSKIKNEIKKIVVVSSEEDVQKATNFLGLVKTRLTRIEELRKFFVAPLNEQVKKINSMFKEQSVPLNEALTTVKRAIGNYRMEQERKAREEEERLIKLQEKKNERREAQGKPIDLTPAPTIERPETTVKAETGKATTKKVWKFKIEDIHNLPLKYRKQILELAVEKGLANTIIRKVVQAGEREIAGVKIWEEIEVSVSIK